MEARASFTEELKLKTIVIKDRTLRNNYASAYAVRKSHILYVLEDHHLHQNHNHQNHNYQVCHKMYQTFASVWHECGYSWDDMLSWLDETHVPSMQITHVEVLVDMDVFP